MYGSYIPSEDGEANNHTATGSFNLQYLIESSRRYEKRNDKSTKKNLQMSAVRWNTGKKTNPDQQPVRQNSQRIADKYKETMKELFPESEEENIKEENIKEENSKGNEEDLNNSFIEDPLHKLLETPVPGSDRDSGSYTQDMADEKRRKVFQQHTMRDEDTDLSLIRALQPLRLKPETLNTGSSSSGTRVSPLRSRYTQGTRNSPPPSRSPKSSKRSPDSGSFTADTDVIQELRNTRTHLEFDSDEYPQTSKPSLSFSVQAEKPRFQPVRFGSRKELGDLKPVRWEQNKENLPEVEAREKLSIKDRLEALSGRDLTHPSGGDWTNPPPPSLRTQAGSRLVSAPTLLQYREQLESGQHRREHSQEHFECALESRGNSRERMEHRMEHVEPSKDLPRERYASHSRRELSEPDSSNHSFIQEILSSRNNPSLAQSDRQYGATAAQRTSTTGQAGRHAGVAYQPESGTAAALSYRQRQPDGGRQAREHRTEEMHYTAEGVPRLAEAEMGRQRSEDVVRQQNRWVSHSVLDVVRLQDSGVRQQDSGVRQRTEDIVRQQDDEFGRRRAEDPARGRIDANFVERANIIGSQRADEVYQQRGYHDGPSVHEQTPQPSFRPVRQQNPEEGRTPAQVPAGRTMGALTGPSASRTTDDRTMPPPSMSISRGQDTFLIINKRRYKILKLLGKGGSSRVYETLDEEKNTVVAVKRVDLSNTDEGQAAGYVNEINMLRKLQGEDRIVKLYDYEKDDDLDVLYVVMEKGDTDLASLLKDYANHKEITKWMINHYWTEMLHAVDVIHKNGIIHSDLKPANFLLVAGRLKLIDFGIASSVQSDMTSVMKDTQMGTFNFMSPEAIQDLSGSQYDGSGNRRPCIKISYKSDVWSLGCILYNLTYGKMPFGDIKMPLMKLQAILNPNHKIDFPQKGVDPKLRDVIMSCLNRDVKSRPSIEELLNHSYVTDVDSGKEEAVQKDSKDPKKMLAALESLAGVLSPVTFEKTRRALQDSSLSKKLDSKQGFH